MILVSDLQRSRDTEGGSTYRSDVSYSYEVSGREFVAARTRFGDRLELSWSAPALRIVRRYPKSSRVLVHYDPDEPSEAVLEPGVTLYVFGGLMFGAIFALLGFGLLFDH